MTQKSQKIYIVTGKGGVGKSTVAAALAQKLAAGGAKTVLVELGEQSYFEHVYRLAPKYEPNEIKKNLFLSIWSGELCLREYVRHLIKVKTIADLFFENKIMKTFLRAAPALKELAILGKATSGVRRWGPKFDYDNVVIDAYSSGHLLALISAPIGMAELIDRGPMGEQSKSIIATLSDPAQTKYLIVTLPEELPVTEAIELRDKLKELVGVEAKIICNKVYRSPVGIETLKAKLLHKSTKELTQFLEFIIQMLTRQDEQISQLKNSVGELLQLPLVLSPEAGEVINSLERQL